MPATLEAEAKVTKILDSAFYSVARLVPEEESPDTSTGGDPPKEAAEDNRPKGEVSPKAEKTKEEEQPESPEEKKGVVVQPSKKPQEESKGVDSKSRNTEERKPLPGEEKRKRTTGHVQPKHQKEKEKRRRRRRRSTSAEVSGSEVRTRSGRPGRRILRQRTRQRQTPRQWLERTRSVFQSSTLDAGHQ